MGIVNNILNLVDLNTTKYSKKLQGMRRDTKNAAKGIAGSFSSIGSAWKGAIAAIAAGALSGAITKELQATERASRPLSSLPAASRTRGLSSKCCSKRPATPYSLSTR